MPDQAPETEAREFAAAFSAFLDWIHHTTSTEERNEVAALVARPAARSAPARP
jgi:hypothetical protein